MTADTFKNSDTGFTEVEGPPEQIRLLCNTCENVLKKRRDSFLPGTHVAICTLCHNHSSEIVLLTGEVRQVTAADHRGGGE